MSKKPEREPTQPGTVEVSYKCRDNGTGVEEGVVCGHWTGEVDTWGKRTFQPWDGSPAMYFFDDEIIIEGAHGPSGGLSDGSLPTEIH
jgi:hypothetical protein